MSWIFVIAGLLFVAFALLLMFGSEGGIPQQPGARRGRMEKPIRLDRLLPPSYDSRLGTELQVEIARARGLSATDRIRVYQEARTRFDSAVLELDIAKLALDKLHRDRAQMGHQEYQNTRSFIETTLNRADRLIDMHSDDYPPDIKSYSRNLRKRLSE
jgi:hypothetical protein